MEKAHCLRSPQDGVVSKALGQSRRDQLSAQEDGVFRTRVARHDGAEK
jgi:hypothetical protein